jgi:hypothetical protein
MAMSDGLKAQKLNQAAGLLGSAASAYRHGRRATANEKTTEALNLIADVTTDEGWKIDVELREDGEP